MLNNIMAGAASRIAQCATIGYPLFWCNGKLIQCENFIIYDCIDFEYDDYNTINLIWWVMTIVSL